MPRRLIRPARAQLEHTEFATEAQRKQAEAFMGAVERRFTTDVTQASLERLDQLGGDVAGAKKRYADIEKRTEKLRERMDSDPSLTAAQAGEELDALRYEAEQLDQYTPGLKAQEDRVAEAMADPIASADSMFERAPSLRRPEFPW